MIIPPCGCSALLVEHVRVPAVFPYPLFYRCGECHYEWHRDWAPHYRVEMEALAKPHMDPSRHAAYIAAHRGRILQTTRSGQERTTHG